MKADHGGLGFFPHVGSFRIESRAYRARINALQIHAKLLVIPGKSHSPGRFAFDIGRGLRMAKKVHIKRPGRLRRDGCQFVADGVNAQHGAREAARTRPRWKTAIASALPCAPAMDA